ncbi:PASTA domain-containing protein [Arthrobacter sp. NPDC090010]|uniref:PASTA domain-containing protein n=1 Tax=Arthrobacter sp. NPDC090010 TaxID=3363942 RepID=UPI0038290906
MAEEPVTEPLPLVPLPAAQRTAPVIQAAREVTMPLTLREQRALRHERAMSVAAERASSWSTEAVPKDLAGHIPADERGPRRKAKSVGGWLFVLVVLLAGGGMLALIRPWASPAAAASVPVPPVRGLSAEQASDALRGAGLLLGGQTHRFHPTVPRGKVSGTDPGEGTNVTRGSAIVLLLSDGPPPRGKATAEPSTAAPGLPVPVLSGRRLDDSTRELSALGLTVGTITESDSAYPAGTVLSSSPGARELLRPGAPVDLTVASGMQSVPLGLLGRSVSNVIQSLRTAGFAVVVDGGHSGRGADAVAGLSVPEGSRAAVGSVVTVRVAVAVQDPPSPTPGGPAAISPSPQNSVSDTSRPGEPSTGPAG